MTHENSTKLIDWISKATPGDKFNRALDAEIAALLQPDIIAFGDGFKGVRIADAVAKYVDTNYNYLVGIAEIYDLPEFTTSLDAAVSLIPNGYSFKVGGRHFPDEPAESYSASVHHIEGDLPTGRRPYGGAASRTPALALVKAILRTVEGA